MQRGSITIKQIIKKRDDLSFTLSQACLVRFYNAGQSYLQIDDGEVIPPGEAFIEGDLNGPGIDHSYKLVFLPNATPPAIDKPRVYGGNHVIIRLMKRKANA